MITALRRHLLLSPHPLAPPGKEPSESDNHHDRQGQPVEVPPWLEEGPRNPETSQDLGLAPRPSDLFLEFPATGVALQAVLRPDQIHSLVPRR